ncbi:MAG TPA: 2-octaprenyl-6-methoxyphenyl hydroxylase, partial [Rhodospirillaceae bacterium]|nr:2-octaprenyl-6-methoxyphenyl hydroxylase [Rhodospirillaceae bacterium]
MSDYSADVLIVGGGLVGGPLAVALADAGLTVVVADAEDPATAVQPEFDGRASALGLAQQRVLAAIGLWPAIEPLAAEIREVRVADGVSPLFLHYDHRLLGDQPLGWIVENRALRQAVLARLTSHPRIRLAAPSRPLRLDRGATTIEAGLSSGETVTAALAVAADGRASPTRDGAGIGVTRWNYGQSAIVCTVAHERPHGNVAQEHFLPAGPFAILPLPGRRSSVVWTERQAVVPAIMAQGDDAFLAELGDRFGDYL